MRDFADRSVAVLGMGRSGLAAAKVLHELGAHVYLSDSRPASELQPVLAQLPAGVELEMGGHTQSCAMVDLIVVSPGIPRTLPILQAAEADGVELIGEVELAYRLTSTNLVAITGTNGKTTTTTLIGEILREAGWNAPVGGNIGIPLVTLAQQKADCLVAEISSFQLETVKNFRPHVGVWLNFSDDHLNRHGTREAYWGLKKQLFTRQREDDYAVLNADDPAIAPLANEMAAQVVLFSRLSTLTRGICLAEEQIVWKYASRTVPLLPASNIQLRGEHNLENCLAAAAAAVALGVPIWAIARAITNFQGVEHRIEPVRTIAGVQWFNDSKGTNYDSTIKAILAFSEPLVLIAGGRDKGGAISPLIETICRKVEHTILTGEAAPYFDRVLRAAGYETITLAFDLASAVSTAHAIAKPGGVVLFSPACTSFDMFSNFEERGTNFKALVRELADG
ncbi:MAG: UDP-N-acetylmuramoyl-L-alanine--D-glutamate ligase [Cyanobacteria bacterium NC_groundwater_1444_Ag_S-0.65um_54_12]|nr:UDP-N-acetylmuramoyl-L-alanine--D-glutamate ligase [Cyanobacteria bacterium NC_groundwater_1444_Ag_S-0.65um_54_12]